jgi:hypothetical protein
MGTGINLARFAVKLRAPYELCKKLQPMYHKNEQYLDSFWSGKRTSASSIKKQ